MQQFIFPFSAAILICRHFEQWSSCRASPLFLCLLFRSRLFARSRPQVLVNSHGSTAGLFQWRSWNLRHQISRNAPNSRLCNSDIVFRQSAPFDYQNWKFTTQCFDCSKEQNQSRAGNVQVQQIYSWRNLPGINFLFLLSLARFWEHTMLYFNWHLFNQAFLPFTDYVLGFNQAIAF